MCVTQKQKGWVDYGLFAIAYAYELVSGNLHLNDLASLLQSASNEITLDYMP